MAQRLIRRLCPHCKEAYHPRQEELPPDFPWERVDGKPLFRSVGCRTCRNVGYTGRFGIYELMVTTEEIRELAHERVSSWTIKQAALKQGMRTLRMDAWNKAIDARTSIDEVMRVTKGDRIS
jgi:general secretion pathway protein E/type IV pilus assembly protein PilB